MRRQRRRANSGEGESERVLPELTPLAETIETLATGADETSDGLPPARVTVRRRLPALHLDWGILLIIAALIGLTAFSFLLARGTLPRAVITWWPLAVAIIALLWFLRALIGRDSPGLLGSAALAGASLSLLLASAYQVPLGATLVGVALIAIGMGILIRGLFWRQQTKG